MKWKTFFGIMFLGIVLLAGACSTTDGTSITNPPNNQVPPAPNKYLVTISAEDFNKDLNIGYEYITGEDETTFTQEVVADLDKACESNVGGPYIKTIDTQYIYGDTPEAYEDLENIIQDFIADLRSRGII